MAKVWKDPVKDRSASESTLNTSGDFAQFTDIMRKLMQVRPEQVREASSASPDADGACSDRSASSPSSQSRS